MDASHYRKYHLYLSSPDTIQRYAPDTTKNQKSNIRRYAPLYLVSNGTLYRKPDEVHPNRRRVILEDEVMETIARYHTDRAGGTGHWHRDATIKAIEKEVYIQDLRKHVVNFITRCPSCQLTSSAPPRETQPLHPIVRNGKSWDFIGIDLMQLPLTVRGN
jgi:hypothetical protein